MEKCEVTSAKGLKHQIVADSIIFCTSLGFGSYLFFTNPWLVTDFYSDSYSWFLDFSRTIFQPQSNYYAESILLPLIAKIIGFSKTLQSYKILCAILTLSILPVVGLLAHRFFKNLTQTLIFIGVFGLSFQYLHFYILGFPDPLTIVFLIFAVFIRKSAVLFLVVVLAMLSHFSMAAIGVLSLAGLVYFSPSQIDSKVEKNTYLLIVISAIISGKLILLSWYALFHYKLVSRLDWVLSRGYPFFEERYLQNITAFWLTPGIVFLLIYGLILGYFVWRRAYAFVFFGLVALVIAYAALFWTVDGLRVFTVVIAAPYVYLLITFFRHLSHQIKAGTEPMVTIYRVINFKKSPYI